MRKHLIAFLSLWLVLSSCGSYNNIYKTRDFLYKYEAAKQIYAEGQYNRAYLLLDQCLQSLKGTEYGEEALYLAAMAQLRSKSYGGASAYFKKYYEAYPNGLFAEEAQFNAAVALYLATPEPKLDQSETMDAIRMFQEFLDSYPTSSLRESAQSKIFELQDKLVEKQYLTAKLYYDLGSYIGNGVNGNYQACIVTAENAIRDFPYSNRREEFAILVVRAKFEYAKNSVPARQEERYSNAIDEYYGFLNEYPESSYRKEATKLYESVPERFRKQSE
ncbi:MAG: outer membrane protein assembly factor BamD [Alloprevotella sp.]|nr:outer membrane protein assembly factor BamD [Alloprevotella sp.]